MKTPAAASGFFISGQFEHRHYGSVRVDGRPARRIENDP